MHKRMKGFAITAVAALAGALLVETARYMSGRPSWMLDPIMSSNESDVEAKLYFWRGQRIGVRPNGDNWWPGDTWTDVRVTIYCGSDYWTYDCPSIANEKIIPLREFVDSRGNRFKYDERRPQRARMTGIVREGISSRKARIEQELFETEYSRIYSPDELKQLEAEEKKREELRKEQEKEVEGWRQEAEAAAKKREEEPKALQKLIEERAQQRKLDPATKAQ